MGCHALLQMLQYLHKIFGILCERFVFSLPFISLPFISVRTHRYLFYIWGNNSMLFYFDISLAWPHQCGVLFFIFERFLTFWHHKMLQTYLFPAPVL